MSLLGGWGRPRVYVASKCIHLLLSGFVANYAKPLDLPAEADAAVQPFLRVRYQLVFAHMTGLNLIQIERRLKPIYTYRIKKRVTEMKTRLQSTYK